MHLLRVHALSLTNTFKKPAEVLLLMLHSPPTHGKNICIWAPSSRTHKVVSVQRARVGLCSCSAYKENACHTGTISKSLFVTRAANCISKCPVSLPAGPCQESRLTAQSLKQAMLFIPFFPACPFALPLYMQTLVSFSSNQKVFLKWHPVWHISRFPHLPRNV